MNKIIDFRGKTPLKLGMKWGGNISALSAIRVILLKFNEKLVSNEYMYQYLRSPYFKKQMNRYATGTTAKGIKQKNLIKIRLKIPSLLEQKFIGTFLSAIDKKIGFMERNII